MRALRTHERINAYVPGIERMAIPIDVPAPRREHVFPDRGKIHRGAINDHIADWSVIVQQRFIISKCCVG